MWHCIRYIECYYLSIFTFKLLTFSSAKRILFCIVPCIRRIALSEVVLAILEQENTITENVKRSFLL